MAGLTADPLEAARLVLSLRRNGIVDDAVLSAIETVDRAAFVSEGARPLAREDVALPIPCGQSIPKPLVTAQLLQALALTPGESNRVLLVGAGSGYTATLLAQLSRHVYAVERFRSLAETARTRLSDLGVKNVTLRHGDGLSGLPEHSPFDRILLAGSVTTVPAVLIEQLDKHGILAGIVVGQKGQLMLRRYKDRNILREEVFNGQIGALTRGVSQSL